MLQERRVVRSRAHRVDSQVVPVARIRFRFLVAVHQHAGAPELLRPGAGGAGPGALPAEGGAGPGGVPRRARPAGGSYSERTATDAPSGPGVEPSDPSPSPAEALAEADTFAAASATFAWTESGRKWIQFLTAERLKETTTDFEIGVRLV